MQIYRKIALYTPRAAELTRLGSPFTLSFTTTQQAAKAG